MAGRKGRSGGGGVGLMPLIPDNPAPRLDGTITTNQKFCAWVAVELAAGNMDPRTADSLIGSARAEAAAIRTAHALHEMDELRSLVARQEKATTALAKAEQDSRYSGHSTGTASLGRVRAPDGDPH